MAAAAIVAAASGTAVPGPGLAVRGGDNDATSMDGDVHGWAVVVVCGSAKRALVSTKKKAAHRC